MYQAVKLTQLVLLASFISLLNSSYFYGFGNNNKGQLGTSKMEGLSTFPAKMEYNSSPLIQVKACVQHTLILNSVGQVFSVGYNIDGRLGIGSTVNQKTPQPIQYSGLPISKISCWDHSLFLDSNGTAYASGSNAFGKSGIGNKGSSTFPFAIVFSQKFSEIAAGLSHSLFLTISGAVYSVGSNGAGQLGNPSVASLTINLVPIQWNSTGGLIKNITSGETHSLVLTVSGRVYLFGANGDGQLGDGTSTSRNFPSGLNLNETIIGIAGGVAHTLLLNSKNEVYSFGRNGFGELCDGTLNPSLTPRKIVSNQSFISVASGHDVSLLLTNKSEVFTCGRNDQGQLGDFSLVDSKSPVKVFNVNQKYKQISSSKQHSIILSESGIGFSFGSNQVSQLGVLTIDPSIPNLSEFTGSTSKISSGNQFSIILSKNNSAYTFGDNSFGNLGKIINSLNQSIKELEISCPKCFQLQ
jgi:alpha-tubulin suppressor-like RCC1 family protein